MSMPTQGTALTHTCNTQHTATRHTHTATQRKTHLERITAPQQLSIQEHPRQAVGGYNHPVGIFLLDQARQTRVVAVLLF